MFGQRGRDTLNGQRGDDLLEGGVGSDVFVYGRRGGDDIIADFQASVDTVDVSAFDLTLREGRRLLSRDSDGITIDFGREGTLRMEDVSLADLLPSDFVL